jgi:hypothetical protein
MVDGDQTADEQGTVWTVALQQSERSVSSKFPSFVIPGDPSVDFGAEDIPQSYWDPIIEQAVQYLHLFGLSEVTEPASLFSSETSVPASHDEVHVLDFFSGGGAMSDQVHLGVSLSYKSLQTLRTPFIDMSGQECDLGFIPYRRLDSQLLTVYGIRPDHFWNDADIYQQTADTLRQLRFQCRSNVTTVPGDSMRSSIGATVTVASRGDFDPDVTRQMKPKDYTEYVKKLIAQHGQEALFTGDSNEDRTVWRALLHEIFGGPMPLGLPKYCMIDIVFATLVDGKGRDKKKPKEWMQDFLTKHNQRAIRFGKEPELSLNGSMSASKRVDALSDLIAALEKSFPVTDLTGAMISGLGKLKLKCLSDLDEHFESIYNYLAKIYEAEKNDPHYAKLPGYYEQHDLQRFVVGHFSQLSKTLDKHIKLAKEEQQAPISAVRLFIIRTPAAPNQFLPGYNSYSFR